MTSATSTTTAPAATTAPPATTAPDLGWSLGVVFRAYVKAARAATADLPGGPRCHEVLAAVAREAPGSQAALAQRLGIDRTVLTYLLDDLVEAKLVRRRADPADRRNRRVVATAHGRQVLADLDRQLASAEERLLAGLDTAQRSVLRDLLARVAIRANDRDPIDHPCDAVRDIAAPREAPPAPYERDRHALDGDGEMR